MPQAAQKQDYESRKAARSRAEKYYPDEVLKKQLNDYMMDEHCKSELAVRLLRSFFKARKTTGQYPTVITLLP